MALFIYLFIFKVYFIDYAITVIPVFFSSLSPSTLYPSLPHPPAFPPRSLVYVHGLYM